MAIGARLRHARLLKGLLIKDLAQRVGVSISLISKYENDKLLPPLTALHSLVTELETNIGALFEPNWTGVEHVARAGHRPRISAGGDKEAAGVMLERLVPTPRATCCRATSISSPPVAAAWGRCAMKATSSATCSKAGCR
jgi:transcriptional regulator with XRE-family HTH domain